jgi:hypothetical protein
MQSPCARFVRIMSPTIITGATRLCVRLLKCVSYLAKRNRNRNRNGRNAHVAKPKRNTKKNSNAHFAKPKRNKKQVRCPPFAHLAFGTKRNETEMGEIDLEAPFRFILFFFGFQCHPSYSTYLNRVVHLHGGFMLNPARSKK